MRLQQEYLEYQRLQSESTASACLWDGSAIAMDTQLLRMDKYLDCKEILQWPLCPLPKKALQHGYGYNMMFVHGTQQYHHL